MNPSIWTATAEASQFPALDQDIACDVAIVGGGITGITTGMLLAEAGKSVVVLEAYSVGDGTTGNSTGNLYAIAGDGLAAIAKKWDEDVMRQVAQGRSAAMDMVEANVSRLDLDCAFERVPFHWAATEETHDVRDTLEGEHDACEKAGLSARIVPSLALPFPTGPALVLDGQAQFHPLRYVRQLARRVASDRCRIFERTQVLEVDAAEGVVRTDKGVVRAGRVVLATHTPKGFNVVQTELGPYREYAVAVEVPVNTFPAGVFWTLESSKHSIRRMQHGGREYVMVLGGKHKTGQEPEPQARYAALEDYLRRTMGRSGAIAYRWSAQGYYAADGLPYIGLAAGSDRLFVATGFAADGLTWGTLAARLIADELQGRGGALGELFRPTRFDPAKAGKKFLKENVDVAGQYMKDYAKLPDPAPLGDLAAGEGRIAEVHGKRCAVHRTPAGELIAVSPICTHLKCVVHWNRAEQSWDCPCHGSRFAPDGAVLEGPAVSPLERIPLP